MVRPYFSSPLRPSRAASACSPVIIDTKPNPRESRVCGSVMICTLSTSPYFENNSRSSVSSIRGARPVTKRLVPGFSVASGLNVSCDHRNGQRVQTWVLVCRDQAFVRPHLVVLDWHSVAAREIDFDLAFRRSYCCHAPFF